MLVEKTPQFLVIFSVSGSICFNLYARMVYPGIAPWMRSAMCWASTRENPQQRRGSTLALWTEDAGGVVLLVGMGLNGM